MRRARLIVPAALLIAASVFAFGYLRAPAAVETVAPVRGDAAEIVYATGVVEPRQWAKVTTMVRERITELCRCEGDAVVRGDVLVRLDDSEARATLAELTARRNLAAREVERLESLAARNVASQQSLDRAQSELVQVEALVAGQTARLASYELRAPVDGIVLRQDGEVGEIAEPGVVLAWVGQPQPLVVLADVNEEDIPRVAPGQRVLMRADAFPERAVEAEVERITPKGDPQSKTYRVWLALAPDTPLMIGMSVEANIVVRIAGNALLVPSSALQGSTLFVAAGRTARRLTVETGIRGTEKTEILSGLAENARVIAPFPEDLADRAAVRTGGD